MKCSLFFCNYINYLKPQTRKMASYLRIRKIEPEISKIPKWKEESSVEWAETKPKVVKFSYTWSIEKFSELWELMDTLQSPIFPANAEHQVKWHLELAKKKTDISDNEFLSLSLHLAKWDSSRDKANFKCSILNHEETVQRKRFTMSCNPKTIIEPFIYSGALFDQSKQFLTNDTLIIYCEIFLLTDTVCICGKINPIIVSDSKISADFGKLLESKKFSDVVIETVGGQEIPAHKNILSARSEVFERMFNNDTKDRITIYDLEPEVLREVLRFLYTDTAPKLDKMCGDLLAAANKYMIERLKNLCESSLLEKLTGDNAADTFLLANTHNAIHLQAQTFNFINDHFDYVEQTTGWKKMIRNNPNLITEHFHPKYFPMLRLKSDTKQFSCEKCG